MNARIFSFNVSAGLKKMFLALLLLLCLLVLIGSVFYIFTDYLNIVRWYLNFNDCFYHQREWATEFFTSSVKATGNGLAAAGGVIAILMVGTVVVKWKSMKTSRLQVGINTGRLPWYFAILLLAFGLAGWEWYRMLPANDEVFSAVNCAARPSFSIVSYYMLPNNHIYYNLLNRLSFFWWGDFVMSGRFISLLAFGGVLVVVFRWLYGLIGNNFIAFILLLPVAFQFHTWGFASQARGYELQLLCGWISVLAMLEYASGKHHKILFTSLLLNIFGFMLIPSYLYCYLAQLMFLGIVSISRSKWDWQLFRYQLATASLVFLAYLPALCFSGVAAFSDNKWVRAGTDSLVDYLPKFGVSFSGFISDCFSGIAGPGHLINYVVFLLPVGLLVSRKKENRHLFVFYLALWVTYIAYSLLIRRTPFHRTLIIQFSITSAISAYSLYVIAQWALSMLPLNGFKKAALTILLAMPIMGYSFKMYRFNRDNLSWMLYGYDVNATHSAQLTALRKLPPSSTIAVSDDAFYYIYAGRKLKLKLYTCTDTRADYFIKIKDRAFPPQVTYGYMYEADAGDDFGIYRKR